MASDLLRPSIDQQFQELASRVKKGDDLAFARLLTMIERSGASAFDFLPELLTPPKLAFRMGLTGPPGAGKSTLMSRLIAFFRAQNLRVGILAVDPSSPFSKGAVLGDRIRYSAHFNDPDVFIRSLGSRGSLGGLSSAAYTMVRAFDLANFDIVLLETVGVGQTELDVMHVADWVSVLLVPESGDSIQGMKAGLLEIAHTFVVNKSDRPGADAFVRELELAMQLDPRAPSEPIPILQTTATTGAGVEELGQRILFESRKTGWQSQRQSLTKLRAEGHAMLRAEFEKQDYPSRIETGRPFWDLLKKTSLEAAHQEI